MLEIRMLVVVIVLVYVLMALNVMSMLTVPIMMVLMIVSVLMDIAMNSTSLIQMKMKMIGVLRMGASVTPSGTHLKSGHCRQAGSCRGPGLGTPAQFVWHAFSETNTYIGLKEALTFIT